MISRTHESLFVKSQAIYSDCEQFRFHLERTWGDGPKLGWLMLNPSTATELVNDPTIERCQRRAVMMGYHGIQIVNLFPYRMTDSTQLHTVNDLLGDPAGLSANEYILKAVQHCEKTICGWGKHALAIERARDVLAMLSAHGYGNRIHCLRKNLDGSPRHPLYVGYDEALMGFEPITHLQGVIQ